MSAGRRLRMVADLKSMRRCPAAAAGLARLRRLSVTDAQALGRLAYEAFKGGVDDHGEPVEDHIEDVRRTLAGDFGPLMIDASTAATAANAIVAAVIITWEHGGPFMPYCLTAPTFQRRGIATYLIARSAQTLRDQGHEQLALAVLDDNPARRLYLRLGFREAPLPTC